MTDRPLTILFMPESAYGPTNHCVGIGDVLRQRGHRVVFAAEASWKGKLAPLGFEEDLVDLAPPPPEPTGRRPSRTPAQFWKDFIRDTAPEFRKPTVEQLETFMAADVAGPDRRRAATASRSCARSSPGSSPDVIVEDNVVVLPGAR